MSKTWLLKKVLSMTKFLLMREVAWPRLFMMNQHLIRKLMWQTKWQKQAVLF